MLKLAYEVGRKIAFDASGLTPEQMAAAERLYGMGGGLLGALAGGAAGRQFGTQIAEAADWNPEIARLVGMGLGGLGGAALGGAAGQSLAPLLHERRPIAPPAPAPAPTAPEAAPEPAHEPTPPYPEPGFALLDQIPSEEGLGFMQPIYEVTPGSELALDLPPDNIFALASGPSSEAGYGLDPNYAFDPGWYGSEY